MKTILAIQQLDRQIRQLTKEVDKCPASVDFKNYKKIMQEGKARFASLEAQANEIIKNFYSSSNKLSSHKGDYDIIRKRNTQEMDRDSVSSLLSDANNLVGEVSEENRRVEDLVRRSEEIVRKSADLSNKLTEAKKRSAVIKEKIEQKRQEVAPKIAEIEAKIKELEPSVKDQEKYKKYKDLKANGIFPVYVNLEDNFCGGCKVELPLNFIEKLKVSKMLPCEHCARIIMLDK
ncbi:MAG: hypothetical protein E7374_03970 [Clostridiales bacterium]|nr:hypothetical protein [Clostridiales bacterium]